MRYADSQQPANHSKLPGYQDPITYNPLTHEPISIALCFDACYILENGCIKESILPNSFPNHTTADRRPLHYIQMPYHDYQALEAQTSLNNLGLPLPWQPCSYETYLQLDDSLRLLIKLYKLSDCGIIFCRIHQSSHQPSSPCHLEFTDRPSATHVFLRVKWEVPVTWNLSSYSYEQSRHHCSSTFSQEVLQQTNALSYIHAVSAKCRFGVDYWILPLAKSPT